MIDLCEEPYHRSQTITGLAVLRKYFKALNAF
jgi:hypothetical protein